MDRHQQERVAAITEHLADAVKATLSVTDSTTGGSRPLENELLNPVQGGTSSPDSEDDATSPTPSTSFAPAASPESVVVPPAPLSHFDVEEDAEVTAFRGKRFQKAQRQESHEAIAERDVVAAAVSMEEAEPLLPRTPRPAGSWHRTFQRLRHRTLAVLQMPIVKGPLIVIVVVMVGLLTGWLPYLLCRKQKHSPEDEAGLTTPVFQYQA